MNSYCGQIADELNNLKSAGADIPDSVIEETRKGAWGNGSLVVDRFKGVTDCSALSALTAKASREEYPDYWAGVDSAGGWRKGDLQHNLSVLKTLLS